MMLPQIENLWKLTTILIVSTVSANRNVGQKMARHCQGEEWLLKA